MMSGDLRRAASRAYDRLVAFSRVVERKSLAVFAELSHLISPLRYPFHRLIFLCSKYKTSLRQVLFTALLGGLIAAIWVLIPILQRLHLRNDFTWYDLGWYGLAPTRRYHTLNPATTNIEWLRRDVRCSQDFIFLAPRGPATLPTAVILDANGELVYEEWNQGGDIQDFKVQWYKGRPCLSFWVGNEGHGRKEGMWFLLDESYQRLGISPGGQSKVGDMHEFVITKDDTALISIYEPIEADLSPIGGPKHGYLLDGIFQELDIETGDVLFEWHASSHMPLNATYLDFKGCTQSPKNAYNGCGDHKNAAFDFYHLNSLEKDDAGNYLVSSRSLSTLSYIDGETGEVLWNLGGKLNEFEDLSHGAATGFAWQHHARFHDDGTAISLFDNTVHGPGTASQGSKAMVIDVDVPERTAKVRRTYPHPQELLSYSQGDVQLLEDTGNVFVGWGRSAGFSEFSEDGELLCDARFGAAAFFSFGAVTSYRVFHAPWFAQPMYRPSAKLENGVVYVSWNGATEVTAWRLEGTHVPFDPDELSNADFETVMTVARTGFETAIQLTQSVSYKAMRVVALDKYGTHLDHTWPLKGSYAVSWLSPLRTMVLMAAAHVLTLLVVVVIVVWARRRRRKRWHEQQEYQRVDEDACPQVDGEDDEVEDDADIVYGYPGGGDEIALL